MDDAFLYGSLVTALGALVFAVTRRNWIYQQDGGTPEMQKIAKATQDGAMAFLKREYTVLLAFTAIVFLCIGFGLRDSGGWWTACAFLYGAFSSSLAGYVGMRVATRSAVRTTQAAKTDLGHARLAGALSRI